jgi:general secretion pathway protein G
MILRTHRTAAPVRALRNSRTGFTLLEVLVVVAIIVMLAGVGGYYMIQRYEEARISKARIDANSLSQLAEQFELNNDRRPNSIQELVQQQPNGGAPLCPPDKIIDPWGQPYFLDPQGPRNGGLKADVYATHKGQQIGNFR